MKLNAVHILQRRLQASQFTSLKVIIGGRDSVVGISTTRGSKPAEGVVRDFVFSAPVQTSRGIHPASSTMHTGALSQRQSGRGVALTSDPHVAMRLRMSRAEPLLPPVSPLVCYGATFTFTCHSKHEPYKCDWKPQSQPQFRRSQIHRPTC